MASSATMVQVLVSFVVIFSPAARVLGQYTAAEQQILVDDHNNYRKGEGASNMNMLKFNPILAQSAQILADSCDYRHRIEHVDGIPSSVGQNMLYHSSPTEVSDVVSNWFSEKIYYDHSTSTCQQGKKCGHYTAVVWAATREVGCGWNDCSGRTVTMYDGRTEDGGYIYVCNYWPGGNVAGQDLFKEGAACTRCDSGKGYCKDDLCNPECDTAGPDCTCKQQCANSGTVKEDCTCDCGSGKMGTFCEDECRDFFPAPAQCAEANFITCDPMYSDAYAEILRKNCPKSCNVC